MTDKTKPKIYKDNAYYPTYAAARAVADSITAPDTDPAAIRIVAYDRGWAIQKCISGPYWGKRDKIWCWG